MRIENVVLRILLVADSNAQGQNDACTQVNNILSTPGYVWRNTVNLGIQSAIVRTSDDDYSSLLQKTGVNLSVAKDNNQLLVVPDHFTAIVYLCRYKFDLIVFDCNKSNEYIGFLSFLSEKHESEPVKYQLCRGVLNNRGPLNRLWILLCSNDKEGVFGVLQSKDISLIHSRWYIEMAPGFEDKTEEDDGKTEEAIAQQIAQRINLFVNMQVKGCVYELNDLISFLLYSGKHLEKMYPRVDKVPKCEFHEFQDFMGAEFSTFLRHYGSRNVIRRDAYIDGDKNKDQKSVFATWVWENFYNDAEKEIEKKKQFSLYNLMQSFYQVAASMPEDRNGVMRLRETFRRLRYFIDINIYPSETSKPDGFEATMNYFNDAIDMLLCSYSNHTTI